MIRPGVRVEVINEGIVKRSDERSEGVEPRNSVVEDVVVVVDVVELVVAGAGCEREDGNRVEGG